MSGAVPLVVGAHYAGAEHPVLLVDGNRMDDAMTVVRKIWDRDWLLLGHHAAYITTFGDDAHSRSPHNNQNPHRGFSTALRNSNETLHSLIGVAERGRTSLVSILIVLGCVGSVLY